MLVIDPQRRITPTQALKDPWFIKFRHIERGCEEDKLDPEIFNKLRQFRGVSTLKKVALNILVKMTSESKDVEQLREMFTTMDKDQTGYISAAELRDALVDAKVSFDENELDKIIKEVDFHGQNRINYSEFLAATMSVKKILTNERLTAMFK